MKSIKNIFFLFVITFFSSLVKGQNYPAAGAYIQNNSMGAFAGDWRWVNGSDTVQIKLLVKKVFININGGFDADCLVGWHIYKKGQTVIESSYQYVNNVDKRTFLGGNDTLIDAMLVTGPIKDLTKNKLGHLSITLNSSVIPNQLTWKLENNEGIRVRTSPTQPHFDPRFTLPLNMILIKQ